LIHEAHEDHEGGRTQPEQPYRALVIGFGNLDRADDGIAYYVINALRKRLGQKMLTEDHSGLEELGEELDSIFLGQLTPELMEVLKDYQQVIFVDAHAYENVDNLYCVPVIPDRASTTFTHHLTPALLLAFTKSLYHREPGGYLVSIRGYDFDFHRQLSADTEACVEAAVEHIVQLMKARGFALHPFP
jgi:hydrogenase maturation protease